MNNSQLLINGSLVAGDRGAGVINPATGLEFAEVSVASRAQVEEAIAAAKAAFPGWAGTPQTARRDAMLAFADAIHANAEPLARTLVLEQGKPLSEAVAEVSYTEIFVRYFASAGLEPEVVQEDEEYCIEVHYKPLGVVVGITPWNFPLLIGANKIGPAVITGNTIILKPAPTTPMTSLMLGVLAQAAFPPGVVNVVNDMNDLGDVLTQHPDVAKVTFTGSTSTGKKVAASAANSLKRLTLELGGNDAGIVLDDVDIESLAPKIIAASFLNCGQVCTALKRLYVPEHLYDEVCDALGAVVSKMIVGNGMDERVTLGPIQNSQQYGKAKEYMQVARQDGNLVCGGGVIPGAGYFMEPTVVRDILDGSRLVDEEQFAPILPVVKYRDIDDAIQRVNRSSYGLGGSVWSGDIDRARSIATRFDTGTAWINHHGHFGPHIPTGGAKQSGIGVEFGQAGLKEFTQNSVLSIHR